MRNRLVALVRLPIVLTMLLTPSIGLQGASLQWPSSPTVDTPMVIPAALNNGRSETVVATGTLGGTLYLPLVMTDNGLLPPIIPETTNVLTETTLRYLASISGDGAIFTFAQLTPELASLDSGDTMVGGVSPNTPYGFLRKVRAITSYGEGLAVETEAATLEEAVQQGEVALRQPLRPSEAQSVTLAPGVSLSHQPPSPDNYIFYVEIKDVVVYDDDGDLSTTSDQIVANGEVEVDATLNFRWKIRDFGLEGLHFTTETQETVELELETKLEKQVLKSEKELVRFQLAPITVMIGPMPLVIVPVLTVSIGVDGKVHVGVVTRVTQEASVEAGADYENGAASPIGRFAHQFTFTPPTLSAGLDFKGYAGPRVSLLLYGVLGPHIDVLAYLKLEADISQTPWWELFGGLEVPVGVRLEIFGRTLVDENLLAIGEKVLLAQAENIPYGYTRQASYPGDCSNKPPGSCCVKYSDDYIWLVYDGIQGWRNDGYWEGKLIEVAIGCQNAEYYHIDGTDLVKYEPY